MNSDYEKRLETELHRELKGLPDWQAPATLIPRVRAALEQQLHPVWYRQPWQAWPVPAQAACFALLLAFFGALCLGAWKLPGTSAFGLVSQEVAGWFSGFSSVWNAGHALVATFAGVVKQLGNGIIFGSLAALALAWAMCLGVGATCVRYALARR